MPGIILYSIASSTLLYSESPPVWLSDTKFDLLDPLMFSIKYFLMSKLSHIDKCNSETMWVFFIVCGGGVFVNQTQNLIIP